MGLPGSLLGRLYSDVPDFAEGCGSCWGDVQSAPGLALSNPALVEKGGAECCSQGAGKMRFSLGPVRAWSGEDSFSHEVIRLDINTLKSLVAFLCHRVFFVADPGLIDHGGEEFDTKASGKMVVAKPGVGDVACFTGLPIADDRDGRAEVPQLFKAGGN